MGIIDVRRCLDWLFYSHTTKHFITICYNKIPGQNWPGIFVWLPSSPTRRTKSVTEIIPCYFRFNNKQKMLIRGEKPAAFPANKAITERDWEQSLRPHKEYPNPIKVAFQFVQYLKDHPDSTYDDLARIYGISKARVCQMVALSKRLPALITDYLINTDEPEILKHFTERKLRPMTLLASDNDKIHKFNEMKAEIVVTKN